MGWSELWAILYGLIILSTISLILLENRNPLKALSWVIVLLLIPIAGLIFYFIFGKDTRRIRLISRRAYARIMEEATPKTPLPGTSDSHSNGGKHYDRLIALIQRQTENPVLPTQEIEIYTDGMTMVDNLVRDIDRAEHHIHLEYYRFKDDATGRRVADALMHKAQQGVTVRLIYDYVGSAWNKKSFFRDMKKAGVEVFPYLPVVFPLFTSKENYRNHRKIVVIDGHIGYVGGMNISNNYTIGTKLGKWRDTHFRITGLAVNGLQAAFITDWYVASKIILPQTLFFDKETIIDSPNGTIPIQTFTSGPTGQFRTLQQALCQVIYGARQSIRIQTPYFLPTESLNKAIIGSALSGIHVEILVPLESDSIWTEYASRSYYDELLKAGVHIYQYTGGFIHSKLITIDSEIAIIGSANMDFRSMEHNFEISTVVYDNGFTERLEAVMQNDTTTHGKKLDRQEWKQRKFYQKMIESIFRLFSPLL